MTGAGPGTALAVGPHLDDAVFSAGGTLRALVAAGWRVRVVTCFTASVPDPTGFALSTQLDKGLGADIDYMALRRAEDREAQRRLGTRRPVHLPLPEAPHRGYHSPVALFGDPLPEDGLTHALAAHLRPLLRDADLVLGPQALGAHVDHRLTTRALLASGVLPRLALWRDAPYAVRCPDARPDDTVRRTAALTEVSLDVTEHLTAKVDAVLAYATQLGFQFGGEENVPGAVRAAARGDAVAAAGPARHAERLLAGGQAAAHLRALAYTDRTPASRQGT
ncbi:PIG-L deacetylase family protein [Streptomyces sp. NPDC058459]|uniref:PIG-L deacetylase family protein n=1 Tax=Streptomyces sp. NPDC058459 TaxID=3346508 RepID=UPI00364D4A99